MLMYKDGITREVEKHQIETFKNLGFEEVKEIESKKDSEPKVEEIESKKDSEPEKDTEDSKQTKRKKSEED